MAVHRPTPREPVRRPSNLAVALVSIILVGLLGLWAWSETAHARQAEAEAESELPVHKVTHDSLAPTYTYDGGIVRWYVLVDPDYGIEYLINDRGGCCPKLGADGNVYRPVGRRCVVRWHCWPSLSPWRFCPRSRCSCARGCC